MASEVAATAASVVQRAVKEFHGIVVSAGKMDKTIKVKLGGMRYEPRVQKVLPQLLPVLPIICFLGLLIPFNRPMPFDICAPPPPPP